MMDDAREGQIEELLAENALLNEEVLVARRASEITARLVVEQFVQLEEILRQLEEKISAEQKHNAYLAALHGTTLGLMSRLEISDLLTDLVQQAGRLLGTSDGFIYLVSEDGATLRQRIGMGIFDRSGERHMLPGQGLAGKVWESGEPLVIDDYNTWEGRSPEIDLNVIRGIMGVPLKSGSRVTGVIGLAYSMAEERRFGEDEVALLGRFAELASIAIDNARLYTESLEARAAADEANQAKSAFLASVSHELRTPLTSVMGFARIIEKRLSDVVFPVVETDDRKVQRAMDQVLTNAQIIVSEGTRLTTLINNVLDLAKIEAGRVEWNMQETDLGKIAERAVNATAGLFEGKPTQMILQVDESLPTVTGDEDRLLQVIVNLISNAVKFTPEGSVTCRVEDCGPEVRVRVTDTGIGIAPEDQGKVFDQFVQVGDSLVEKPAGTGLGLPISKQIVEHHQGRIWVESTPGSGSTFAFCLPARGAAVTAEPAAPADRLTVDGIIDRLKQHVGAATGREQPGDQRRILVVDDDPHIRELLRQELEGEGYRVREAADGREALKRVREERPHLIILDIMMPELNGYDVAAVLKASPETMGIPIVVVSVIEDKERGFRLGVDRYFTKPLDTTLLLEEVGQLVAQGESRRKVLLIDEDTATVEALAAALRAQGYEVTSSTGGEGMEEALAAHPDIVIANALLAEQRKLVQTLRFERGMEQVYFLLFE